MNLHAQNLSPDFHKALLKQLWKLFVFIAIAALAFLTPDETREVVQSSLSGAYVQVSVFVAVTLAIFYTLEHILKLDTDTWLRKHERFHIPIAAFMGALPGCGGAIIVMTQYVSGRLGFGSVVAVLTSTMGDAAFLLIAREPQTALLVYGISLSVGIVSGYIIEAIHGRDFLREKRESKEAFMEHVETLPYPGFLKYVWGILIIPGFILGIGNATQTDTDLWFGAWAEMEPTKWIGVFGALLSILMWSLESCAGPSIVNLSGKITETKGWMTHFERVVIDTNFVTIWVVGAFLVFELTIHWTGLDLKAIFEVWGPLVPTMAILIGFIPGCGPQVLVTTFYLNGIIPFSAQLGNAISNDGDALFPAIALAPKPALLATIYTAVPAFIVAYGWYFLME